MWVIEYCIEDEKQEGYLDRMVIGVSAAGPRGRVAAWKPRVAALPPAGERDGPHISRTVSSKCMSV